MRTTLPVEEVSRRLRECVGARWAFKFGGGTSVVGTVNDRYCAIYARPLAFVSNSFQRVLVLDFLPQTTGTLLRGQFRLQKVVMVMMGFFLVPLIVFNIAWIGRLSGERVWSVGTFFPFLPLVFWVLLMNFGVWLSRMTEGGVIDFLEETFQAENTVQSHTVPGGTFIAPKRFRG